MVKDRISKLVEICLRIANILDKDEDGTGSYLEEIGLGRRALSVYLRDGAKAVIEMQGELTYAKDTAKYAKESERDMQAFLVDIFGDENPEFMSEDDKNQVKQFVRELIDMDNSERSRNDG